MDDWAAYSGSAWAGAQGVYNGTAPKPVSNRELSKALSRVLHRAATLPAPGFALRLALGEVAGLLLEGQHVTPDRALAEGFSFRFPEIEPAFRDLLPEPRSRSTS